MMAIRKKEIVCGVSLTFEYLEDSRSSILINEDTPLTAQGIEALKQAQMYLPYWSKWQGVMSYTWQFEQDKKTGTSPSAYSSNLINSYKDQIESCRRDDGLITAPKAEIEQVKRVLDWLDSAKQKEEKPRSKVAGYVYLIQSPTSAYKIGCTKNPDNRIATFSVKLPFEVEYVCLIKTEDMYMLESELHGMYSEKRINGEWFNLAPQDVQYIKSLEARS